MSYEIKLICIGVTAGATMLAINKVQENDIKKKLVVAGAVLMVLIAL